MPVGRSLIFDKGVLLQAMISSERGISSSFGKFTHPYIMTTEYPWIGLSFQDLEGAKVLSIGGSGDVPLFFAGRGAADVAAVDVSLPACFLLELKTVCIQVLTGEEFSAFFLADIPRAEDFLSRYGIPTHLDVSQRQSMFGRLSRHLSENCRRFWEKELGNHDHDGSPFAGYLHPTDLFGLHLIPYLNDAQEYGVLGKTAGVIRAFNLSLDAALDKVRGPWDIIYASNIDEYLEMDHAMAGRHDEFERYFQAHVRKVHDCLEAGGRYCRYVYESHTSPGFRERFRRWTDLMGGGWNVSPHAVAYEVPKISNARFRNTLVVFQKA